MVAPTPPGSPVLDILSRSLPHPLTSLASWRASPTPRGIELLRILTRDSLDLLPGFRGAIAGLWRDLDAGEAINEEEVGKKVLNDLTVYIAALQKTEQLLSRDPAGRQRVERADEIPAALQAARDLYQEFLNSWPSASDDAAAKRAAEYPLSNEKLLAFAEWQGPPPSWRREDENLFE